MSVIQDRWSGGDDYERYMGRWSRPVAERFLDWLAMPDGRNWVDVGCGAGALTAAILARAAPDSVIGVDPSAAFVAHAATAIRDPRAQFRVGAASILPLDDRWADVVVSGLVLNFVPDLDAALREMRRVSGRGATIAGYVWDYASEMQLIRRFWDAAVELDPTAAAIDEGPRFPICAPEPLRGAFEGAGLASVEVQSIEVRTVFRDFDDYWSPFLTGVGPAPGYTAGLDEALETTFANGSGQLCRPKRTDRSTSSREPGRFAARLPSDRRDRMDLLHSPTSGEITLTEDDMLSRRAWVLASDPGVCSPDAGR